MSFRAQRIDEFKEGCFTSPVMCSSMFVPTGGDPRKEPENAPSIEEEMKLQSIS